MEGDSIPIKTKLLLIIILASLEVIGAYHLIKKTDLTENLSTQIEQSKSFSRHSPISLAPLELIGAQIKQDSGACLTQKSWLFSLYTRLVSGQDIFKICLENNLQATQAINALSNFKQALITEKQLTSSIRNTNRILTSNNQKLASFINSFKSGLFMTLTIFIAFHAWALIAFMQQRPNSSSTNYKKLKFADQQLAKIEQRLALYFQASNAGIWDILDIERDELYWSPQIKTFLGYDADDELEPSKSTILNIIHPDHRSLMKQFRRASFSQSVVTEELLMLTKSDGYKWFRCRAIGSIDPITGKMRLTGSISDIHTQKVAEQKLSESIAFMKLLLDNNPDMVFVKNRDHLVIEGNRAYFAEYPESMAEHRKMHPEKFKVLDADDDHAFKEGYSESIHNITLPSGSIRNYHSRKIRFENLEQEEFLLVLAHDITDTEDLIAQITRSNQDLEQFAFIASHDLQEPLRMIATFSDLLEHKTAHNLDEESTEYLRIIKLSVNRMRGLVQDLLAYAKINESNTDGYEAVDLNSIMEEILENFGHSLDEVHGTLTYDYLPTVVIRKSLVRLLISNLVSNAIKYQRKGTIPKIHVSVAKKAGSWEFCVEDNGIGIEEKFLKQIFLPFKRLHRKEEYIGTGIGLSICQKAVDQLNGRIWAKSSLGFGSRFFFSLPAKPILANFFFLCFQKIKHLL